MGKTQGELLTDVRSRVNEATAHHWDDTELRRWINDAVRDMARRTECILAAPATIVCVAGTAEYTAPIDAVRLHMIEYNPGDGRAIKLEYMDRNNLSSAAGPWLTTEGTPLAYSLWGVVPTLKIRLYPVPTQASTMTVFYYKVPADLATATNADAAVVVNVPEGWSDLVATYAEYRAYRKDADPRWQDALGLYNEALLDLNATAQRWVDEAGVISTGTSHVPGWLWMDG